MLTRKYLKTRFTITAMGQMHQYSCMQCGHQIKQEVPDMESPMNFGDKVICGSCGSTQPKNYNGPAY